MASETKLPKSVDEALRTALKLLDECKEQIPAGWPEKVMIEEATIQLLGGIQLNAPAGHARLAAAAPDVLCKIEHHLEDIAHELAQGNGKQGAGLWRG